ncbi:MAG: Mrp/NBP35 family ATP-binding protein [Eubacteriales bacterium]
MSECTHDCSQCAEKCADREASRSLLAPANEGSEIGRVIGVISGKGGVGKSLVTSMLAVTMQRRGYRTAILDADITGPSIPRIFGLAGGTVEGSQFGMVPPKTKTGIEVMSVNLLMQQEDAPVVWRGPIIAGTVKQFWTEVFWGKVDFMFVDMPPGTGDVPLTVFQSLPLDGIILVTSPQELVSMIVGKALHMAQMMHIPVLGLVENYSYFVCPDCGHEHPLFGEGRAEALSQKHSLPTLARVPLDPKLAALCDKGIIELMENDYMEAAAKKLESLL